MQIIARLPNAGLANKLLIWSEAIVFANRYGIAPADVIVYPWFDLHLKRILRRDRDQRIYGHFFKTNDILERIKASFAGRIIKNPNFHTEAQIDCSYIFSDFPDPDDYFEYLRGHEQLIRLALLDMVRERFMNMIDGFPSYDVAIHVRRGDFPRHLRLADEEIAAMIAGVEKAATRRLKFYLFSDGAQEELRAIAGHDNIEIIQGNPAIVDLLLMSKAKIIIPAIGSTFSYFSAFLSEALIIRHKNDNFGAIRKENKTEFRYAEMPLSPAIVRIMRDIGM